MLNDQSPERSEALPERDPEVAPPPPAPPEEDERTRILECRAEGDRLVCAITPEASRRLATGRVESITLRVIREAEPSPGPAQSNQEQSDGTDDED